MQITGIDEQQKSKERVNVMVDGSFGFGVHMDVLLDYRLKVGMELSEQLVSEIKAADAFRQAYDKALNYLSSRPHSAQEMRQYLRDKLIYKHPDYADLSGEAREIFRADQETAIERIAQKLIDVGYIDDVAFAKWWIANRREFRPRGKRLLLLELKTKGVSDADIQLALTTPNEEGHFNSELSMQNPELETGAEAEFDEVSLALRLAKKQHRKYAELEERDYKQKMSRYLANKGFDWDVIEQVLTKLQHG